MRRLIVHADDLGADEARNEGIFEALEAGSATAASILANGPALRDAFDRIASSPFRNISFGLHLNLTEGVPLSGGLKFLISPNGCFHGKAEAHKRLLEPAGKSMREEIRREFAAQFMTLREAGMAIDHVDGHQHVHVFPAALDAVVESAEEFGIPWIRVPDEQPSPAAGNRIGAALFGEADLFSRLGAAARLRIQGTGLRATDHFRGLYLKGRLSPATLEETLQALPPGLTELMVHPGRVPAGQAAGPFSSFSHRDREWELEVLMDGGFRDLLQKHRILLTPFPEARP